MIKRVILTSMRPRDPRTLALKSERRRAFKVNGPNRHQQSFIYTFHHRLIQCHHHSYDYCNLCCVFHFLGLLFYCISLYGHVRVSRFKSYFSIFVQAVSLISPSLCQPPLCCNSSITTAIRVFPSLRCLLHSHGSYY